jgi:transposase
MAAFFANLPPALIGLEACASAHHWARKLQAMGHTVKLMAPQFVKPYVKTNKNDVADAEAICEAVARPNMRFVPVKNLEQQAVLAHCIAPGTPSSVRVLHTLIRSVGCSANTASSSRRG